MPWSTGHFGDRAKYETPGREGESKGTPLQLPAGAGANARESNARRNGTDLGKTGKRNMYNKLFQELA